MRTAVQSEALQEIFDGKCDYVVASTVLSSKIAVTAAILTQYELTLGANQHFQAWFASASQGRITLHLPNLAPNKVKVVDAATNGYGTASYYGGSNLVANIANVSTTAVESFASIGVKLIPITQRVNHSNGDNPIFTIGTETNGILDFEILDRFLLPEESIVIYDKYINSTSIELLEHIAKSLTAGSIMRVFHTYKASSGLLDSQDIFNRLNAANLNITIECKKCSTNFKKKEHDRYIFLGNRIQIVFTAGLDCFGKINATTGRRINRMSKINFYDVTGGDKLAIEAEDNSTYVVNSVAFSQ